MGKSKQQIMGYPDDLKLKSCMTLSLKVESGNKLFESVLDKFFNGEEDANTVEILKSQAEKNR